MIDTFIKRIRKRDGRLLDFDQNKITEAIWKAVQVVGGHDRKRAEEISDKIVEYLEKKIKERQKDKEARGISTNNIIPDVEEVQDCVEKVLIENGNAKTAKRYILYREERKKLRDVRKTFLDSQQIVRDYLGQDDWRVNENANIGYSHSGLLFHAAGTIMAYYGLNYIYPPEIGQAHINSDFHIHDLSMSLAGYCAGWSLRQILKEGFNGVPGKTSSAPANHMRTAIGQMVNFIGTLTNEWAGAQALSSVDTYLAPFVRVINFIKTRFQASFL